VSATNHATQLEKQFLKQKPEGFPRDEDYRTRYKEVTKALAPWHSEVDRGALLAQIEAADPRDPNDLSLLTHHGYGHVDGVIRQLWNLLETQADKNAKLTPYEMYLLLMSAQIHDLGNIFGRQNHATRCGDILAELGTVAGSDHPEKLLIAAIAAAHCKSPDGEEDTISPLESTYPLQGETVRPQFLAAMLRLADELADDKYRASVFLESNKVPTPSEVFHRYSACLDTPTISGHKVQLRFYMDPRYATSECGKGKGNVFLLDEICDRTLKMHRERLYCSRFLRVNGLRVDGIDVRVSLVRTESLQPPIEEIKYSLQETGYPNPNHSNNVRELDSDFEWTGASFCQHVKTMVEPK
jgi:hypothetical protein